MDIVLRDMSDNYRGIPVEVLKLEIIQKRQKARYRAFNSA